jgi:hypothetical protein
VEVNVLILQALPTLWSAAHAQLDPIQLQQVFSAFIFSSFIVLIQMDKTVFSVSHSHALFSCTLLFIVSS